MSAPHSTRPSVGQLACGLGFGTVGLLLAAAQWRAAPPPGRDKGREDDHPGGAGAPPADNLPASPVSKADALESGLSEPEHGGGGKAASTVSFLVQLARLDTDALARARHPLRCWLELGLVLALFHVTDRTGAFEDGGKHYSRDTFTFICLSLLAFSAATAAPCHRGTLLNRDQTDEWKGWMQVLFLLYHYFEAKEFYNGIRLCIAAYVWMTGFGNFSYYAIKGDFSAGRVAAQLWRLNLFVFLLCCALNNSYMLYYICPMHTLFTLFVYAAMRVRKDANMSHAGVALKLAACTALVILLWDVPGVFHAVWAPFGWLVTYTDPRFPGRGDPLYEWRFRSGLDRYIWIYGMLCAHCHPAAERLLHFIDALPGMAKALTRAGILVVSLVVLAVWHSRVYILPKVEYNALHPYTSWIPLTVVIIWRNLWPELRRTHLALFAWLGKITLETYLCQFHIWLHTGAPDAQPGRLFVFTRAFLGDVAGDAVLAYPLVNFFFASAIYILISRRVFDLTSTLSAACVPLNDIHRLREHLGIGVAIVATLVAAALALQALL